MFSLLILVFKQLSKIGFRSAIRVILTTLFLLIINSTGYTWGLFLLIADWARYGWQTRHTECDDKMRSFIRAKVSKSMGNRDRGEILWSKGWPSCTQWGQGNMGGSQGGNWESYRGQIIGDMVHDVPGEGGTYSCDIRRQGAKCAMIAGSGLTAKRGRNWRGSCKCCNFSVVFVATQFSQDSSLLGNSKVKT